MIWSPVGDKIYIGSTTKDYLSQRMTAHRIKYKSWKNNNTNDKTTSFDLFDEYGVDNCFVELLEEKACTSKDEKNKLEGSYIRTLSCINRNIPDRTKKEYNITNKEKQSAQKKLRYENNIVKIKEKQKIYTEEHKEQKKIYDKEYNLERFTCECSGKYTKHHKAEHERCKKHQLFLKNTISLIVAV